MPKQSRESPGAVVADARAFVIAEADALIAAAGRLGDAFDRTVAMLNAASGKTVLTGIGKSGQAAAAIAATFCSLGTPAVFLHAAEAAHGDFGVVARGDVVILISKSGASPELVQLAPMLRAAGAKMIALVGNLESPLAREADEVLDASVNREADPLGLAPTSSVVVALAIGHALASALAKAKGVTADDFARAHPKGQLGRNLLFKVVDVMHHLDEVAVGRVGDTMRQIVIAMTERPLGAACIVDGAGKLLGLVTDGDVRRAFQKHDDIRALTAGDVMTVGPIRVLPDTSLREALHLMEDRKSQISVLPVVGADGKCLGLIRLHDIYQH